MGAQAIPLRCDGELNEAELVPVDRLHQLPHGRVQTSDLAVKESELYRGQAARLGFELPPRDAGASAGGVSLFQRFEGLSRDAVGFSVLDVL
jgi:hypothetical protein